MKKDELIKELKRVADVGDHFLKNCMLCDSDFKVVADVKDIIEDEDEIRLTIFRVIYRGYKITPF